MSISKNVRERVTAVFNPKRADALFEKRLRTMTMQNAKAFSTGTGYAQHGASRTKKSMLGWVVRGGNATMDADLNSDTLRKRARDLDMGGGIARGATRTLRTNVVNSGLRPKPRVDYELLGMTEAQTEAWQKAAAREFSLWAESHECDATGRMDFYQLQRLAFLSYVVSGDVIALLPTFESRSIPYQTHVRLLEADRLGEANTFGESNVRELPNGNRIIDGVETDVNGRVVAYHILNKHPLDATNSAPETSVRIPAYGETTGMPNVLHVMEPERPEQLRGVPYISPMIEQMKQLSRYVDSELMANIIASYLTVFIEQEISTEGMPLDGAVDDDERVSDDDGDLELGQGVICKLAPGQKATQVNPGRTNAGYKDYVEALITQIGSSMEIPKEVLLKSFNSNYSASRAALVEFWNTINPLRGNFISCFCQPIYEAWLAEAVASGRMECKGFFDDPAIRKAWCGVEWMGIHMGSIDPLKEVNAAEKRIALNISTEEREAAEFNGSNWHENIVQRKRELEQRNAMYAKPLQSATDSPPDDADEPTDTADEPNGGNDDE